MTDARSYSDYLDMPHVTYTMEEGLSESPGDVVWRITNFWIEDYADPEGIALFEHFIEQPGVEQVEALVLGDLLYLGGSAPNLAPHVDTLRKYSDRLQNLKYLYIGDVNLDYTELVWVWAGDMGRVLEVFPNLHHLRVRGGSGFKFNAEAHEHLRTLAVESLGLDREALAGLAGMKLPELTRLEVWLGGQYFEATLDDVTPLITGPEDPNEPYPFPKLTHLGLPNNKLADDVAEALLNARVLEQLTSLDLSGSVLTNRGAQALVDNPAIEGLASLDLSSNYIEDEQLIEALALEVADLNADGQKSTERYVSVRFWE